MVTREFHHCMVYVSGAWSPCCAQYCHSLKSIWKIDAYFYYSDYCFVWAANIHCIHTHSTHTQISILPSRQQMKCELLSHIIETFNTRIFNCSCLSNTLIAFMCQSIPVDCRTFAPSTNKLLYMYAVRNQNGLSETAIGVRSALWAIARRRKDNNKKINDMK